MMGNDDRSSKERAAEAREALSDPQRREQMSGEPGRLADAVESVLRLVDPRALPCGTEFAERSGCGGWFAAEDLCLQMAIKAKDDAGFDSWLEKADAYHTVGEACEALQHTL